MLTFCLWRAIVGSLSEFHLTYSSRYWLYMIFLDLSPEFSTYIHVLKVKRHPWRQAQVSSNLKSTTGGLKESLVSFGRLINVREPNVQRHAQGGSDLDDLSAAIQPWTTAVRYCRVYSSFFSLGSWWMTRSSLYLIIRADALRADGSSGIKVDLRHLLSVKSMSRCSSDLIKMVSVGWGEYISDVVNVSASGSSTNCLMSNFLGVKAQVLDQDIKS